MATVGDLMTTEVVTVHYKSRVREALSALYEHDIRRVPVVDDFDRVVGIVTDRDLREHMGPNVDWGLDPEARKAALDDPVSDIMTTDPTTVEPELELGEFVDMLIETKFGGAPVVNETGKLLGIVTYIDVLRALRELID